MPAAENLTLVGLTLLDGVPPFARFRAAQPVDNLQAQSPGYYLAIGSQAYGPNSLPNPGDIVAPGGDFTPVPLLSIAGAIGGGPLIYATEAGSTIPTARAAANTPSAFPPPVRRSRRTERSCSSKLTDGSLPKASA